MSSIEAGQAGQAGRRVAGAARQAGNSVWVDRLARLGLMARGLVYILVGILAFQVAFVNRSKRADQNGAFQLLAQNGFGKFVLWLVVLGLLGYALWQATQAFWGHWDEPTARKRLMARIESGAKAVIYFILAVTAFRVVTSGSGGNGGTAATAKLLKVSGGQFLVGFIGVVIVAVGATMVWRGLKAEFAKQLQLGRLTPAARSMVIKLGKIGYIARGVVFAIVGILVVAAAVTFDPAKARGLDAALRSLAAQPYGPWLLSIVAVGLICFGAYSFVESRYRRV
jgi:Domain of Unknown Function (DUF1206)